MSMSSPLSSPLLLLSFFLLSTFPCLENINFLFPGNFNCLFKNFDDSALCVSNKPILWGLLSCETKTVMPSVTPSCVLQLFEEGMMANQPIVTSTVIFIFQKKKEVKYKCQFITTPCPNPPPPPQNTTPTEHLSAEVTFHVILSIGKGPYRLDLGSGWWTFIYLLREWLWVVWLWSNRWVYADR